jgi:hypothetical protein
MALKLRKIQDCCLPQYSDQFISSVLGWNFFNEDVNLSEIVRPKGSFVKSVPGHHDQVRSFAPIGNVPD